MFAVGIQIILNVIKPCLAGPSGLRSTLKSSYILSTYYPFSSKPLSDSLNSHL